MVSTKSKERKKPEGKKPGWEEKQAPGWQNFGDEKVKIEETEKKGRGCRCGCGCGCGDADKDKDADADTSARRWSGSTVQESSAGSRDPGSVRRFDRWSGERGSLRGKHGAHCDGCACNPKEGEEDDDDGEDEDEGWTSLGRGHKKRPKRQGGGKEWMRRQGGGQGFNGGDFQGVYQTHQPYRKVRQPSASLRDACIIM